MKQDFIVSVATREYENDGNIFEVADYTHNIDISHIIKDYPEEMGVYNVSNDERIEVISYNIHETSNYWDLLLLINDIKDWRHLPVSQDKLEIRKERAYQEWLDHFGSFKSPDKKQEYKAYLDNKFFEENEKYRKIQYINKGVINEIKARIKEHVIKERKKQFVETQEVS